MPDFSNAPMCTIDVRSLKESRFLLPAARHADATVNVLPYRDEWGRVCTSLLRWSEGVLARLQGDAAFREARLCSSEDVEKAGVVLKKWSKHAGAWKHGGSAPSWTRTVEGAGAEWTSSDGEVRCEVPNGLSGRQLEDELRRYGATPVERQVTEEFRADRRREPLANAKASERESSGWPRPPPPPL